MLDRVIDKQECDGGRFSARLGAYKGYNAGGLVESLKERGITPHVATVEGRKTDGFYGRQLRSAINLVSQRTRKRVEEIFGLMKTAKGFR